MSDSGRQTVVAMTGDKVRVWDLSSDIPHRPTVSHSSPPHSSSPSKSLPATPLQQELNEILTPVINKLMSPPISPKSQDQEPKPMATGAQYNFSSTLRRLQVRESQESLLGEFIQWDRYRGSSESLPHAELARGPAKRPSVRRTDFTSKVELKKQAHKNRFLFHRGFFARSSNGRRYSTRNKGLRSKAEIEASLTYTNLRSFRPEDVVSSRKVIIYRPRSIVRPCPGVKVASEVPVKSYVRELKAKSSTKRTHIRRLRTKPVGRSNTCPAAVRNIRRRTYSPETRAVHELWAEYLSLVIAQRIQLRVSLSKRDYGTPEPGFASVGSFNASSTKSSIMGSDKRLSSMRMNC